MRSSSHGFSLIEVMVALTLLGLIAALLTSGTRLALDISARGNTRSDALRTQHRATELLRGQLSGALPLRYWTGPADERAEHFGFAGEAGRIRFVSREGIFDGPNSLPRWVELRSEQARDGRSQLVVEERRILSPDNIPGDKTAGSELLDCDEVRFAYLDMTGDKPQWVRSWPNEDRSAPLPSAVRVECRHAQHSETLLVPIDYADSARQGMVVQ